MNITHVKSHGEAHLFEIVKDLIGILVMLTLIGNKGYIKSVIAIIIHRLVSSKVYVPDIPVTLKVPLFLLHHRSDPCIPDNTFLSDHLPQQILFSYPQRLCQGSLKWWYTIKGTFCRRPGFGNRWFLLPSYITNNKVRTI